MGYDEVSILKSVLDVLINITSASEILKDKLYDAGVYCGALAKISALIEKTEDIDTIVFLLKTLGDILVASDEDELLKIKSVGFSFNVDARRNRLIVGTRRAFTASAQRN